ncbi:nucleoside monophosphate kinase [Candidatus Woesebacteria bacterium]|nr:nucleoside monophosphate kinase [Candidatus Woesebacteria bacterium]
MIIIILGPQGSGKGTQAKLLAEKFGLFYFEAGGFLRQVARTRADINEIINKKGALLPDEVMNSLVLEFLEKQNIGSGIVFDGFPRTIAQYEMTSKWFSGKGMKVNVAFLIQVSEKESVRRLSARRVDRKTGEIYNLITNPPPPDLNLTDLIQREDDQEEVVKTRLDFYKKSTLPLVRRLKNERILVEVDGERPIDVIQKDLVKVVESTI